MLEALRLRAYWAKQEMEVERKEDCIKEQKQL